MDKVEMEDTATEVPPEEEVIMLACNKLSDDNGTSKFRDIERETNIYSAVFRYLIIIVNIAYYTCVIPLCFKKTQDGYYKIHTNKIQKILTFVCNVTICIILFRHEVWNLEHRDSNIIENPEAFIHILSSLSKIPKYLMLFYMFWTQRNLLEDFVHLSKRKFGRGYGSVLVVNVLVLTSICCVLISNIYGYVNEYASMAVRSVNQTTDTGKNSTFAKNVSLCNNINFTTETKTFPVLQFLLSMYLTYIEELFICLNFISAIMIYHIAAAFVSFLKTKDMNISKVSDHYLSIRDTTKSIRGFFGPFIFVYTLENLFNCLHFPFASGQRQVFTTVLTFSYVGKYFITIIIAAEASLKMKYFKEWLFHFKVNEVIQDCSSDEDEDSNETDRNFFDNLKCAYEITKIGLGCKLFTLTYGFIGLFISVLATYGAFQLQFYNVAQSQNNAETYIPECNSTVENCC